MRGLLAVTRPSRSGHGDRPVVVTRRKGRSSTHADRVREDRQLTLNIAHRIRDGFLHTRFPLLQKLDGEPHHWATDDPRLVQIVQTTRKEIQL